MSGGPGLHSSTRAFQWGNSSRNRRWWPSPASLPISSCRSSINLCCRAHPDCRSTRQRVASQFPRLCGSRTFRGFSAPVAKVGLADQHMGVDDSGPVALPIPDPADVSIWIGVPRVKGQNVSSLRVCCRRSVCDERRPQPVVAARRHGDPDVFEEAVKVARLVVECVVSPVEWISFYSPNGRLRSIWQSVISALSGVAGGSDMTSVFN